MSGVAPSHSTSSKANLAKKKVVAQLASLPCHNKTYKSLKTNHTEHKKQNSIEQNNYNSTT